MHTTSQWDAYHFPLLLFQWSDLFTFSRRPSEKSHGTNQDGSEAQGNRGARDEAEKYWRPPEAASNFRLVHGCMYTRRF